MSLGKPENELPLEELVNNSIVDVVAIIPGTSVVDFQRLIKEVVIRPVVPMRFTKRSLYLDSPDRGIVYTNLSPSSSGSDVTSFHFPGASGQWDEERCGTQFDGYAGAALRGGVKEAVILDWRYAQANGISLGEPKTSRILPNVHNEVDDVIEAIKLSGAKRVYLSARSYGAQVILFAIPKVKEIGVEIAGIDLKVPAIGTSKNNERFVNNIGDTPIIIIRGDHDVNTNIQATDDLFDHIASPKAMLTLTDINDIKHVSFNHHLDTPELRLAAAAATESFIKSVV